MKKCILSWWGLISLRWTILDSWCYHKTQTSCYIISIRLILIDLVGIMDWIDIIADWGAIHTQFFGIFDSRECLFHRYMKAILRMGRGSVRGGVSSWPLVWFCDGYRNWGLAVFPPIFRTSRVFFCHLIYFLVAILFCCCIAFRKLNGYRWVSGCEDGGISITDN